MKFKKTTKHKSIAWVALTLIVDIFLTLVLDLVTATKMIIMLAPAFVFLVDGAYDLIFKVKNPDKYPEYPTRSWQHLEEKAKQRKHHV